jgi:beta-fructofuranosidase
VPDHLFPLYHLRPPTGYVNDPNGPVLIEDRVHLYYQYRPATDGGSPVFWGHASSADFVNWQHHRAALSPSPDGLDRNGCWSGNTVREDGVVHAFYSAYRRTHAYQSVVVATSHDGGHSFGPPRPAVPDPAPDEEVRTFRDPFVWRAAGVWRMVVGAGAADGTASARLYESDDLRTWAFRGPLAAMERTNGGSGDTGAMWECPQLLTLDGLTCLLVSTWSPTDGTMDVLALLGPENDGGRLGGVPSISRFDHGPDFYAASALRDSPHGPVVWGWVREARSKQWCVEADWSGMLTLPRSVRAGRDGRNVHVAPLPTLEALRGAPVPPRERPGSGDRRYGGLPAQLEVQLARGPRGAAEQPVRLRLRCSADEHLDVVLDRTAGVLTLDRERASRDARATGGAVQVPLGVPGAGPDLRLFVDGSVVEAFTGCGRSATMRFYPTTPPPWELELSGLHPGDDVQVWPLAATAPDPARWPDA